MSGCDISPAAPGIACGVASAFGSARWMGAWISLMPRPTTIGRAAAVWDPFAGSSTPSL